VLTLRTGKERNCPGDPLIDLGKMCVYVFNNSIMYRVLNSQILGVNEKGHRHLEQEVIPEGRND
jgi:hypothetical protein